MIVKFKDMKKIYIKLALVLAVIFGCQACFELEEDTSSIIDMKNLKDEGAINAALTSIYRQYSDAVSNPHDYFITGYGADDITTWWAGNKGPLRVFDRFDYGNGENSDVDWLDVMWDKYWKLIYYSNSLIEGLKTSSAPEDVVKQADAEARFFRAIAYFGLVQRYGNMPLITDGMTPTGDELRVTVIDNYVLIENDLKIAEAVLPRPEAVANVGKVSLAAVKALMAEFYMTWAGWPVKDNTKYALAAQKSKDIIDMGYFELLKFDELWTYENQNSKESVFSAQYSESENIRNQAADDYAFHMAGGWSDAYPEKQFFYDFPDGLRKEWTFYTDIPNLKYFEGKLIPKDPATIPWENSERKHPMYRKFGVAQRYDLDKKVVLYRATEVYRYAEVLLTFAEATARTNGGVANAEALEALNKVKRRAMGLPYNTPDVTVDVTSATAEEIMQEKAWELAGELGKRWWDLVRTETVAEVAARRDPTENVDLAITPAEITWKQYIGPIPYKAILTSKLTQNPEGFKIN